MNHTSLFILCSNLVYTEFLPKGSGSCGPGYLAPSLTEYSALNASQFTNVGSFIHELVPHGSARWEVIEICLCFTTPTFSLKGLIPNLWRLWIEKSNPKSLYGNGRVNITMQTLKILQSEANSLASMVLQNGHILTTLTAQQGGIRAIISDKCCFCVN